jgi:hypothetical protein
MQDSPEGNIGASTIYFWMNKIIFLVCSAFCTPYKTSKDNAMMLFLENYSSPAPDIGRKWCHSSFLPNTSIPQSSATGRRWFEDF